MEFRTEFNTSKNTLERTALREYLGLMHYYGGIFLNFTFFCSVVNHTSLIAEAG